MRRPKPPAPAPGSADDIELEFYESLQRGDIDRLMAPVVRRRRDLLRPSRRRRAWSARPRSAPRSRRCSPTARSTPGRKSVRRLDAAFERGAQRARAHPRHRPRGRAVRLGRRDQRLPEGGARLAAGGAPRQPGHARRECRTSPRRPRCCTEPAARSCRDARLSRAALAAGRPCADDLAGVLQPPLRRRRRRGSSASAGPRPTATSSTSTGSAATRGSPLLVLFHGLEGSSAQPLRPSLRRRGARGAAGASRCRTFAAARASSTWRRAPTTRATTRRSAGCWRACARCTRGPIVAVGVSLGGNALLR